MYQTTLLNQSKRIAVLVPKFQEGGLEKVAVNLVQGFTESGYTNLDLVISTTANQTLAEIPPGVRVIDLNTTLAVRLRDAIKLIYPLTQYLRKEKPDLIISNLYNYNIFTVLAKKLARSNGTLVLVEHIPIKEFANKTTLLPILMRWLYPQANYVVPVSRYMGQQLIRATGLKPDLIRPIYNPVINPTLREQSHQPVDHPWFVPGNIPVILAVGRLADQKDFSTLIYAFADVKAVRPCRLVILGSGPRYTQLNHLIEQLNLTEDVALLGFTANPYAYMSKASVFVLSSRTEALPTVLIEAMAVGIPVVSTNCESGPSEILADGTYGWLVPVGDKTAMANAILKVLSGERKPIDAGWLAQFTVQNAVQTYLDLVGWRDRPPSPSDEDFCDV